MGDRDALFTVRDTLEKEWPNREDQFAAVYRIVCQALARDCGNERLREEADALYPFFNEKWEPLRLVAERCWLEKSPQALASRARNLLTRGLIESRWVGHYSIKEYRRRPQQAGVRKCLTV